MLPETTESNGRRINPSPFGRGGRAAAGEGSTNSCDYLRKDVVLHAVGSVTRQQLAALLLDPELPLKAFADRPVKLSHTSLIVEAQLELIERAVPVAYKRWRAKSWWKAALAWLRPSRAARGWQLATRLLARDVPTPRPLVMVERRGLDSTSYLATQWIAGSTNLHLYLWQLALRPAGERRVRLRQAGESVARVLGAMHSAGCANRDLKALNLVVVERPDQVDAWLVDLDGVRPVWRLTDGERSRNLARLATSLDMHPWLTRTDRLRFLLAYLRASHWRSADWKTAWHWIARHHARIRRRLKRQGRPVA
jgi:tRNA A-37 threonylcarbamoyl transferase component Bud32